MPNDLIPFPDKVPSTPTNTPQPGISPETIQQINQSIEASKASGFYNPSGGIPNSLTNSLSVANSVANESVAITQTMAAQSAAIAQQSIAINNGAIAASVAVGQEAGMLANQAAMQSGTIVSPSAQLLNQAGMQGGTVIPQSAGLLNQAGMQAGSTIPVTGGIMQQTATGALGAVQAAVAPIMAGVAQARQLYSNWMADIRGTPMPIIPGYEYTVPYTRRMVSKVGLGAIGGLWHGMSYIPKGIGAAVGAAIGTTLAGPIGGFVGGTIGYQAGSLLAKPFTMVPEDIMGIYSSYNLGLGLNEVSGINIGSPMEFARHLQAFSTEMPFEFNTTQTQAMVQLGISTGAIGGGFGQTLSGSDILGQLRTYRQSLLQIMKVFKVGMQEASETIAQMKQLGIDPTQASMIATQLGGVENWLRTTGGATRMSTQLGAGIAQQVGLPGAVGADIGLAMGVVAAANTPLDAARANVNAQIGTQAVTQFTGQLSPFLAGAGGAGMTQFAQTGDVFGLMVSGATGFVGGGTLSDILTSSALQPMSMQGMPQGMAPQMMLQYLRRTASMMGINPNNVVAMSQLANAMTGNQMTQQQAMDFYRNLLSAPQAQQIAMENQMVFISNQMAENFPTRIRRAWVEGSERFWREHTPAPFEEFVQGASALGQQVSSGLEWRVRAVRGWWEGKTYFRNPELFAEYTPEELRRIQRINKELGAGPGINEQIAQQEKRVGEARIIVGVYGDFALKGDIFGRQLQELPHREDTYRAIAGNQNISEDMFQQAAQWAGGANASLAQAKIQEDKNVAEMTSIYNATESSKSKVDVMRQGVDYIAKTYFGADNFNALSDVDKIFAVDSWQKQTGDYDLGAAAIDGLSVSPELKQIAKDKPKILAEIREKAKGKKTTIDIRRVVEEVIDEHGGAKLDPSDRAKLVGNFMLEVTKFEEFRNTQVAAEIQEAAIKANPSSVALLTTKQKARLLERGQKAFVEANAKGISVGDRLKQIGLSFIPGPAGIIIGTQYGGKLRGKAAMSEETAKTVYSKLLELAPRLQQSTSKEAMAKILYDASGGMDDEAAAMLNEYAKKIEAGETFEIAGIEIGGEVSSMRRSWGQIAEMRAGPQNLDQGIGNQLGGDLGLQQAEMMRQIALANQTVAEIGARILEK